jgi:hypothetical protein
VEHADARPGGAAIDSLPCIVVEEAATSAVEDASFGSEGELVTVLVGDRKETPLLVCTSDAGNQRRALEAEAQEVEELGHDGHGAVRDGVV